MSKLWHCFNSSKQSRQTGTCCCKTPQSQMIHARVDQIQKLQFPHNCRFNFPWNNPICYKSIAVHVWRRGTPAANASVVKFDSERCFLAERHRESNLNSYFCVVFFVFSFFSHRHQNRSMRNDVPLDLIREKLFLVSLWVESRLKSAELTKNKLICFN